MIKSLTQRIRNLNHEFDSLANKRQELNTNDNTEKIDKLLLKMERWESIARQVPLVVSRLQSLKDVHEQSILFGETIRKLTTNQDIIRQQLISQDKLLEKVDGVFQNNVKIIEENVNSIDQRIRALQEKISTNK